MVLKVDKKIKRAPTKKLLSRLADFGRLQGSGVSLIESLK